MAEAVGKSKKKKKKKKKNETQSLAEAKGGSVTIFLPFDTSGPCADFFGCVAGIC